MESELGVDDNRVLMEDAETDERVFERTVDEFLNSKDLEGDDVFEEAHDNLQLKFNVDDFLIEHYESTGSVEDYNLVGDVKTFQEPFGDSVQEPQVTFQEVFNTKNGDEEDNSAFSVIERSENGYSDNLNCKEGIVVKSEIRDETREVIDIISLRSSDKVSLEMRSSNSVEHSDVKKDETFQIVGANLGSEDPCGFRLQNVTENGVKILDNAYTVELSKYNSASTEEKNQIGEEYNEHEIQVDCSSELKYISPTIPSENHSDISKAASDLESSNSSTSSEHSDVQSDPLLQGHHMHSDVKNHEPFQGSISDLGVQDTKDSKCQQATGNVEILNGHANVKDSKSNLKVFEEKHTDGGSNEHEVKSDSALERKYVSAINSFVNHNENDLGASEIGCSTLAEYSKTTRDKTFHGEIFDLGALDVKLSHLRHVTENGVKTPEEPKSISAMHEDKNQTDNKAVSKSASSSTKLSKSAIIRPAGLGPATLLLERLGQQSRVNGSFSQTQSQLTEDPTNAEPGEIDGTRENLQTLRVKFLRLVHRLGQTPHNIVVAQVLYRLGLAEQMCGRNGGRVGSFDSASAKAEQLEVAGKEPLDFACAIMVLGKAGVGKSATINSIFDEVKFGTNAFDSGTKKVQVVSGTVQGIRVRVIDTPGLLPFWSDQRHNEKILRSIKRFIKKSPPDIVLYLDRLDMHTREFSDMSLLRTITSIFGASIWFNAIVVLTHAASAPPDGPNGVPTAYDTFVSQRSHTVQQAVRMAAGDMRLMNPVSLVENHSACRTNKAGQRVLPNGQVWMPHLLLLSFASKILAEANMLLKLQDSPPGKPFAAARLRTLPLPYLLSSLTQSRLHLKLPEEQFGYENSVDNDFDESSDSEDESELDELPPFRRLTKAQVKEISKNQRKAYFDELEYREKLFIKRQLKEERKQRKKMAASGKELGKNIEENGAAASVPVPLPDLSLPASFDSDNPTHRYRFLDSSNRWIVRPVLETHGWDHDVGYEGINVEKLFVVKEKLPVSFSGQVTKDKKDVNLQMEVTSSIKHGQGKATSLGFDLQTAGKDIIYTLRGDSKFCNLKRNEATAGLSTTLMGDVFSTGVKLEDKLIVNKRVQIVMTGGAMTSRGDVVYGGNVEATLRDKDTPLGGSLSTLGLSIVDWHGDLSIGCNIQSHISVGRFTNLIGQASLNKGTGQISLRLNSSELWQIILLGALPLARKLIEHYQQLQYEEC